MSEPGDEQDDTCPGCGAFLLMPYVQCAECGPPHVDICLHCFARGVELGHHHSNHKYKVIVSVRRTLSCSRRILVYKQEFR